VPASKSKSKFQAPRSLPCRPTIHVDLYPDEHHDLIRLIEDRAKVALRDPAQVGYADFLFQRIVALREAAR
jgi:hypothetical protein